MEHKQILTENRQKKTLRVSGLVLLLTGLIALYYGPLEIYCFYLFSDGGRLYYADFGVGSLWFAFLVAQNLIYYLIAAAFLPVGTGLIRLRSWSRHLILTILYSWIALAIPVLACFVFSSGKLAESHGVMTITAMGLVILFASFLLPLLLIKLIDNERIVSALTESSPGFLERTPRAVQVVVVVNIALIILLHINIFFKGIFPVFGQFVFQRKGISIISAVVVALVVLTYGYVSRRKWGFWGLLSLYVLMLVSAVATFARYSSSEIIKMLNYTAYEISYCSSFVSIIKDINFTALYTSFMLMAILVLFLSLNHKERGNKHFGFGNK